MAEAVADYSLTINIHGQEFCLQGIEDPLCVKYQYSGDYENAISIGPLKEAIAEVADAFKVNPTTFIAAVENQINATCTGALSWLPDILKDADCRVIQLVINKNDGIYNFGFCCDISSHLTYGVPLSAFGLLTTYLQSGNI